MRLAQHSSYNTINSISFWINYNVIYLLNLMVSAPVSLAWLSTSCFAQPVMFQREFCTSFRRVWVPKMQFVSSEEYLNTFYSGDGGGGACSSACRNQRFSMPGLDFKERWWWLDVCRHRDEAEVQPKLTEETCSSETSSCSDVVAGEVSKELVYFLTFTYGHDLLGMIRGSGYRVRTLPRRGVPSVMIRGTTRHPTEQEAWVDDGLSFSTDKGQYI